MGLGGILLPSNEQLENGSASSLEKADLFETLLPGMSAQLPLPEGPPHTFLVALLTWPGFVPSQWSGLLYTEPLGCCGLAHSSREPLEFFSDYNHRNAGAITVMTASRGAGFLPEICKAFCKCNCT